MLTFSCVTHYPAKIMKLALRFELLMCERRCQPDSENLNDGELLQEVINRYNNYKANKAIKKWQISPDQQAAIQVIICGMSQVARDLIRSHLDWNKWETSGNLLELMDK